MRVLVVGGTGYLGQFIVQKLASSAHQVRFYRPGAAGALPQRLMPKAKFEEMGIGAEKALSQALACLWKFTKAANDGAA